MQYTSNSGSFGEDLFLRLFSETFGAEKAGYLYTQYPFYDIYQNNRYADFALMNGGRRIAIEIDDDATHDKNLVSQQKYWDDLLKQNSMIHLGWDVYRWTVRQMQRQEDTVKDELKVFLGNDPHFREIDDYLPTQQGKALDGGKLELREYQLEALRSLAEMRERKETIALLYQATGTGKTVTAVMDAKALGGRTLFVAHRMELVDQALATFRNLCPEATSGKFSEGIRDTESQVICGSIQSVALNLDLFRDDAFDYLIIDEAHHASAETYQKILAYFKPKFTLGLTATPERADDINILEIFRNTAHKLDIQTAVEIGALVPVRCIRIRTNIDMTKVRFNSVQYNIRELDSVICVTERNRLIVSTWLDFVKDKRTVVFCASVKHAEHIAGLFKEAGVTAAAVSGSMKSSERKEMLAKFAAGEVKVLCACDLLNEGWDCPEIEVLFMARPTMSKVLYTQQLGRGMRIADGKDHLMVFDFVDNAGQYNAPYSLHRLMHVSEYHPGQTVIGRAGQREADEELYRRGDKPEAVIDYPVDALDYESVNIFNWQEEAAGMISQMEFVRRVDVQSETIEKYIREGKLIPDLIVPMSDSRKFCYFKEETLITAAEENGWQLIDDSNRRDQFMQMVQDMNMSASYKPVLLKAFLAHADKDGRAALSDLVSYFRAYYENRRARGLVVEKSNYLFARE
ncbi:MAG: DEAD/DEAH box helicase, partial [Anaerolineaceae bacterium]|nr:DEAD/DEAH box helicase [Anaerolineaceae bacterium]